MRYRKELDVLGKVKVPSDAYYGSETQRAIDNFPISGMRMPKEFIRAYVMIKKSSAIANSKLGRLDAAKGAAIIRACNEILSGKLWDQFVVDIFQAGAGTNTNMNVNEVIANRAIEILGGKKGDYRIVHPNDHVNMSQSTNDTFHSAIRVSAYLALREKLAPALAALEKSLKRKSAEFAGIVKTGRTHLQDAVPITLGQEFSAYAAAAGKARDALLRSSEVFLEIPAGGTAVGTGINAPANFSREMLAALNRETGARFRKPKNMFYAMQNQIDEMALGELLGQTAVGLGKIANDLRLLSSGPYGGINEIVLPAVQPGSSIMPGKINPSVPEMLNMVCFQVIGNSTAIRWAANAGQLELNVFMPIIAFNLLFSIEILTNAVKVFEKRCVRGIRANLDAINRNLYNNLALATALSPYVGYAKASLIAKRAYKEGKGIIDVCMEMKLMDRKKLRSILDPKKMV